MKRFIYILLILLNCTILYSQTYDSTNGIILKGDGSIKHSHSAYLNVGSMTYTLADSNKFLKYTSSGTFTLDTVSTGSSSTVTWGTISGMLSNQTDLQGTLDAKAPLGHTHSINEVNYLPDTLSSHSTTFTVIFDTLSVHKTRFDTKQNTISNLADTLKYLETTDVKQGAYLSDTTKFSLTTHLHTVDKVTGLQDSLNARSFTGHNHNLVNITGFPDTTGKTGKYLQVLAGGGFAWDSPASGSIPTGVITMWSGSVGSIPSGWVLCDGTNGTPDLRDRFIIGAGGNYAVSNIGGSSSFTPAGIVSIPLFTGSSSTFTPLGTINVVIDNHTNHTHSVTSNVGVTSHPTTAIKYGTTGTSLTVLNNTSANHTVTNNAVTSGNESATLTHNVSTKTFSGNTTSVIPSGTNSTPVFAGTEGDIRPLYYALCYIMKQ